LFSKTPASIHYDDLQVVFRYQFSTIRAYLTFTWHFKHEFLSSLRFLHAAEKYMISLEPHHITPVLLNALGYSDSVWEMDIRDRHSIKRPVLPLNGAALAWKPRVESTAHLRQNFWLLQFVAVWLCFLDHVGAWV